MVFHASSQPLVARCIHYTCAYARGGNLQQAHLLFFNENQKQIPDLVVHYMVTLIASSNYRILAWFKQFGNFMFHILTPCVVGL